MKKVIILFFIIISTNCTIAQDIKNLEALNGFKKFKFGTGISNYLDIGFKENTFFKQIEGVKEYDLDCRNDKYYQINGVQFKSIILKFYLDSLYEITYWTFETEEEDNLNSLLNIQASKQLMSELKNLLGDTSDFKKEKGMVGESSSYFWESIKNKCEFRINTMPDNDNLDKNVYFYNIVFTNIRIANIVNIKKYDK